MAPKSSDIPGVVAPPPVLYAIPLAVGIYLQTKYPRGFLPGGTGPIVGILLLVLGLVAFSAVWSYRKANTSPNPWRPTTALVLSGPYRWSRNPMYLGFTLIYLGVSAWLNTVWPLLALPLILIVMQWGVIAREEAYLEAKFGDSYREYKARVRRWL